MDPPKNVPSTNNSAKNQIIYNYCSVNELHNNFQENSVLNRLKQTRFNLVKCEASFTGRKEELKQIEEVFKHKNIVVICGLGGIGKTELARQFAWKYKDEHSAYIVWINAELIDTITEYFKKLAMELEIPTRKENEERHLPQIIQDIYKILNNQKSLIIFDNVLNKKIINSFLLQDRYDNVKILITCQNIEWLNYEIINLSTLSPNDALVFLRNNLTEKCNRNENDMKKLTEELQYLPLALQQAVAYINDKTEYEELFSVSKYIKEYQQLLENSFPDYSDNSYENTIYKTVSLTVKQISNENKNALKILHLCCYLDADNILHELLQNFFSNTSELKSGIRILIKYSLLNKQISEETGKTKIKYNIHRLVQLCHLSKVEYCQDILKQVLLLLDRSYYLLNKYYWEDLSKKINISDYNNFFRDCPNKNELMYYFGFNECIEIIKNTTNIFNDENYFRGLNGAIHKGSLESVELLHFLMKEKMSPEVVKELSFTAADKGFGKIIKFFHEKHYTIHDNCAGAAATKGHLSVLQYLFTILNIKNKDILRDAVIYQQMNIIQYLVEICYDFSKQNKYGDTALHTAVELAVSAKESGNKFEYNLDIFHVLLTNECDVNIQNNEGDTALHLAAEFDHSDVIELLLQHNKCKVNLQNKRGKIALHLVAGNGCTESAKLLINHGSDINLQDKRGDTPLHLATSTGLTETMLLLVKHGSDLNLKNNIGKTPLMIATKKDRKEINAILTDKQSVKLP